ncbi:MAG TPA: GntR family transcriptional regulator [Paracoccaceae bacterium]|nr:GntR family transcriptional regulator [Paracoccaceae bacterium]
MNSAPDSLKIEQPPQTLREMAIDRLRTAIIVGRFKSGDRLVERTLCDRMGVSRSVVREAIRYLEAEGLVEIAPRSGPMVATLDWNQARQIYDIRLLLEAKAAADCAVLADARVKHDLAEAHKALDAAFSGAWPQVLYDATTRFYEVIFLAAGHEIAWEIVQRLNGRISRLRALTLATTDRHVSGPTRMGRIFDAICANDAEAAARAVREHLTEAAEIARRLLESGQTSAKAGT